MEGGVKKGNNFVCTKENGSFVTMTSLRYLSRIINMELQIKFNFHSLRHTHVTAKMQNSTVNILENILNQEVKLPPN
ncbi:hypothetical protein [Clostridium sp. ZBS2]|uniref:hypothetical protein n=1 Tax=Clostridium sp. ZBS2 TaxID=2949976 RepID=UPI00207AA197|nr:hypothetical protein [Clostridium sp. ZBS2]